MGTLGKRRTSASDRCPSANRPSTARPLSAPRSMARWCVGCKIETKDIVSTRGRPFLNLDAAERADDSFLVAADDDAFAVCDHAKVRERTRDVRRVRDEDGVGAVARQAIDAVAKPLTLR